MYRFFAGLIVLGVNCSIITAVQAQPVLKKQVAIDASLAVGDAVRPSNLLTRRIRETFAEIHAACSQPSGLDDWTAVEWLLTTAQDYGWEGELGGITRQILSRPPESTALLAQARAVNIVGCARRGEAEAALVAFDGALKGIRLRQPQETTNLAVSTALAFQLHGDIDAARAVYERLHGAFFLNPEVRDFVSHRQARLELVGKSAPEVLLTDLSGAAVNWADARGKVLVLDFWATNCRPCLEELPRLRRFYHDRNADKVALLGISLDEDVAEIARLQQQEPLLWPIALDQKRATAAFKVVLIPCLMALDHEGRVAAVDIPPRSLPSTVATLQDRANSSK